ncbi:unnamed protein product [Urochloa decumbens]|uniref:Uncharacterized protein n=1 Tax=Urochloa decumbens TaxID=240449 RepID=A0ABC9AK94_9POAL
MATIRSFSSTALTLLPLLLAAALAPSLASPATTDGLSHDLDGEALLMLGRFHGWMAAHGRSYATEEEKLRRFEIYRSNMEFIEAANRDSRMSYQLGETPFTDLTHDEFMAMYNGNGAKSSKSEEMVMITTRAGPVHEGSGHGSDLPLVTADEPPYSTNLTVVPPSIDWRAKGVVTPAMFQGANCSSCWAFASVTTMESAQAISTGGPPPVLSKQQLVDCDQGCGGGYLDEAFKWVIRNRGITTEAAYPYTGIVGKCQSGMQVAVRLRGYMTLPSKDEAAILRAVARQPVAVGFDGSDPCFQHYIRGVYNAGCSMNGIYTGKACNTTLSAQNHALAIVGYGAKPDGTKYWIAKNSYSELWGDKGFIYLLRDSQPSGVCGLALTVNYPVI